MIKRPLNGAGMDSRRSCIPAAPRCNGACAKGFAVAGLREAVDVGPWIESRSPRELRIGVPVIRVTRDLPCRRPVRSSERRAEAQTDGMVCDVQRTPFAERCLQGRQPSATASRVRGRLKPTMPPGCAPIRSTRMAPILRRPICRLVSQRQHQDGKSPECSERPKGGTQVTAQAERPGDGFSCRSSRHHRATGTGHDAARSVSTMRHSEAGADRSRSASAVVSTRKVSGGKALNARQLETAFGVRLVNSATAGFPPRASITSVAVLSSKLILRG
jgi:hypothetical protein